MIAADILYKLRVSYSFVKVLQTEAITFESALGTLGVDISKAGTGIGTNAKSIAISSGGVALKATAIIGSVLGIIDCVYSWATKNPNRK